MTTARPVLTRWPWDSSLRPQRHADAAPGDVGDSDTNAADTVGADNASLTSVSGAGGSDSTFSAGVLVVNGQYGVLTIAADGNYTYVRGPNSPGGVTDTFNYTLTDGDGDTSTSTLTISIPDRPFRDPSGIAHVYGRDACRGNTAALAMIRCANIAAVSVTRRGP